MVDSLAEHVRACRTGDLHIEGPVTQFTQRVDAATPGELMGRYDCLLLAVKAQHTGDAVTQLLPHLSEDGVVVSLQNGLNETPIAGCVGDHRTIAASSTLPPTAWRQAAPAMATAVPSGSAKCAPD